jgi:phage-related protein
VKTVIFLASTRKDLREFPENVRRVAGYQLYRVQHGHDPTDFKPMPSVGQGVYEIRLHTGQAHRIFYIARFEEAIYVLHAFEKKGQKTSDQDIEIGRQRYQQLLKSRTS